MNMLLTWTEETLFPMAAELALQGLVLMLFVWLLTRLFARAPVSIRHTIWLCGFVALLFLPLGKAILPQYELAQTWAPLSQSTAWESSDAYRVDNRNSPLIGGTSEATRAKSKRSTSKTERSDKVRPNDAPREVADVNTTPNGAERTTHEEPAAAVASPWPWKTTLIGFWLLGALFLFVRDCWQLSRLGCAAGFPEPGRSRSSLVSDAAGNP